MYRRKGAGDARSGLGRSGLRRPRSRGRLGGGCRRGTQPMSGPTSGARCDDSILLALACASIFLIGACGAEDTRSSGAMITRLDGTTIDTTALTQRIEALTRAANVHGLTVTIFNDAEKVYTHGFGVANLPAAKPLRTDTELYGASLSKAVFSVLVMKLVEQRVLDL